MLHRSMQTFGERANECQQMTSSSSAGNKVEKLGLLPYVGYIFDEIHHPLFACSVPAYTGKFVFFSHSLAVCLKFQRLLLRTTHLRISRGARLTRKHDAKLFPRFPGVAENGSYPYAWLTAGYFLSFCCRTVCACVLSLTKEFSVRSEDNFQLATLFWVNFTPIWTTCGENATYSFNRFVLLTFAAKQGYLVLKKLNLA